MLKLGCPIFQDRFSCWTNPLTGTFGYLSGITQVNPHLVTAAATWLGASQTMPLRLFKMVGNPFVHANIYNLLRFNHKKLNHENLTRKPPGAELQSFPHWLRWPLYWNFWTRKWGESQLILEDFETFQVTTGFQSGISLKELPPRGRYCWDRRVLCQAMGSCNWHFLLLLLLLPLLLLLVLLLLLLVLVLLLWLLLLLLLLFVVVVGGWVGWLVGGSVGRLVGLVVVVVGCCCRLVVLWSCGLVVLLSCCLVVLLFCCFVVLIFIGHYCASYDHWGLLRCMQTKSCVWLQYGPTFHESNGNFMII